MNSRVFSLAALFLAVSALLVIGALFPGLTPVVAAAETAPDYLILLELSAPDASGYLSTEEQFAQAYGQIFPRLVALQRRGELDSFTPIPEAGVVLVTGPSPDVFADISSWPMVAGVVTADAESMQAAYARLVPARVSSAALDYEQQSPGTEHSSPSPVNLTGVGGLNSLFIYENETYVEGYVVTAALPITLKLTDGAGTVRSQMDVVSDYDGWFYTYFTATILGGDVVVTQLPGKPPIPAAVAPLSVTADKATDVLHGTAPANGWVHACVNPHFADWVCADAATDGEGAFSADLSGLADIFLGDYTRVQYSNPDGFSTVILEGQHAPGMGVYPLSRQVWGFATPGSTVSLTLKDSSGVVKDVETAQTSSYGYFRIWFWTDEPCAPQPVIQVGDRVEMQYGAEPVITVDVAEVTVDALDPTNNLVTGTVPANGKVEVWVDDDYLDSYKAVLTTALASGQYTADFSGTLDFTLGSEGWTTYHDIQDNEVTTRPRYSGPYVWVSLNSGYVQVNANSDEVVMATLRNGLGAIKGTASGTTRYEGDIFFEGFRDTVGNYVGIVPGDYLEVLFGGGASRVIDTVGLDYVVDRDTRTVYGTGPANSPVRIIPWDGSAVTEITDASGYFSHTFEEMRPGYPIDVIYRNADGNDVERTAYVPQFTIYPDDEALSGYGPFSQAVVATVKDSGGGVKCIASGTTSADGYYWLDLGSADVAAGDTVVVDVGPFHYEQEVAALTVAVDLVNEVVYGTAPPYGFLDVYVSLEGYGPYYHWLDKLTWVDETGTFSADFSGSSGGTPGNVQGGDSLTITYQEIDPLEITYGDEVSIGRYAIPALYVDAQYDAVSGYGTPGAVGIVTIRDSGGTVKAGGPVTADETYGSFDYHLPAGVDLVAGDQVSAQVGVLDQTAEAIPLAGVLDLDADVASGTSLPNTQIGVDIWHWSDNAYNTWTDTDYLSWFVDTDAAGAFSLDLHCLTDLMPGDYMALYYIDDLDTHYRAYSYTTQPTVTIDSHPPAVQPGTPVAVHFTIADGSNPTSAHIRWDTESHAGDNLYSHSGNWQRGAIGSNIATFSAPLAGTVYFRVQVGVDGQEVWSQEHSLAVEGTVATTLVGPVSGTTNDSTPHLVGVASPSSSVTLYEGATELGTTTADDVGWFAFDLTVQPAGELASTHDYYAVASVGGVPGPESNVLHLTVDPALIVDPVNILLTIQGVTQHLRDASGYANLGGEIWTRTSEVVAASIPISCTDVYSADLLVGGMWATPLINSGENVYVGVYTSPGSGSYQLMLKVRCGGAGGPVQSILLLIGLIDPDGYVYELAVGDDHRLAGAQVTCYELVDEAAGTWQMWMGEIWGQKNPQTTGADGYYAFFTLPGKYKVQVIAPHYQPYESPILVVVDTPVRHNVGLVRMPAIYLPLVVRNH